MINFESDHDAVFWLTAQHREQGVVKLQGQ
jgi:hypothetical protein